MLVPITLPCWPYVMSRLGNSNVFIFQITLISMFSWDYRIFFPLHR